MHFVNYSITSNSKDLQSLVRFNKNFKECAALKIKIKLNQKPKHRKIITLLKSPHVNKSAQEQFESQVFKEITKIETFSPYKFSFFFKKFTNQNFSATIHKIKQTSSTSNIKNVLNDKTLSDGKNISFYIRFLEIHSFNFLYKFKKAA